MEKCRDNAPVPQLRTPPRHPRVDYSGRRVFFVTFCVWDRRPVFASAKAADCIRDVIFRYRKREWYWLLSYCVMPDHVHLLLKPRSSSHSLSRIVATMKNESLRSLHRIGVECRWQYGYYDSILRGDDSEFDIARYITQNPVRSGIVSEANAYPFAGIVDRFW
jgi:putative transposase